ncbi:MAG: YkgJ family cysteine cluster protein [Candidatus Hodarchaeales archaeon]
MPQKFASGQVCQDNSCHSCCIETEMPLTEADVRRISKARAISPSVFTIKKDQLTVLRNEAHGGIRKCFFLNDSGKCSIYSIRPSGCKIYPVIWNLDEKVAEIHDFCPHGAKFADQLKISADIVEELVKEVLGKDNVTEK